MRAPTFSDERILAALREAAGTVGEPLAVTGYDAWRRDRDVPSSTLVIRRFGSWTAACTAAGVSSNKTRSTSRRWSDEEVLAAVAAYLTSEGSTGSYAGYVEWARVTEGAPSGPLLRQRGAWADLKRQAQRLS